MTPQSPKVKMAFPVKYLDIALPNVLLPLLNTATDVQLVILYLFYCDNSFTNAAFLTLFWIFFPFFIQLFRFVYILAVGRYADWYSLFLRFPFVNALRNTYLAYELHIIANGTETLTLAKSLESRVKAIRKELEIRGLEECYFQSGPQSVTQLVICLSTGIFPTSVTVTILTSAFSVIWGASQAFFVQRNYDEAFYDPSVMALLRVMPYVAMIYVNSNVMWVAIAGLIGVWVFAAVSVDLFVNYSVLKLATSENLWRRWAGMRVREVRETEDPTNGIEMLPLSRDSESGNNLHHPMEKATHGDPQPVVTPNPTQLGPALSAIIVPSIVGDHSRTYLTTSITTQVTKIFILGLAIVMAFVAQMDINPSPILFWCEENWEELVKRNITACTFDGSLNNNTCFEMDNMDTWTRSNSWSVRVCGSDEINTRISLLLLVCISNLMSLAASLMLNKLKDWRQMYKATRTFLWFIPTTPIIHHSLFGR